ncbi:TetR family transcriptional regulator [Bacillus massiliigorillae]|uniref:TetR family transcriptional regulator n=1 Tax=Bacillus massiliigorillae TaxID=1243664 RepID=UPI00039F9AA2|nr:TetR family transcriptional regulator [Bacillus massiliigorillae]
MSKKAEKYHRILSAAIEIISEKGIEKTSISDIVKASGVAQGTFYLYFSSKSALIPAIAEELLEKTLQRIQEKVEEQNATIKEVIEIMIREHFELTKQNQRVITLCYAGLAFEYSFERWDEIYAPYYQWFEEKLQIAKTNNEVRQNLQLKRTVKMLTGVIEDAAERYYLARDHSESLEEQKQELAIFIYNALGIDC